MAQTVESACNAEDQGSIPGSGRWKGLAPPSSSHSWKTAWTEEPGGLRPWGGREPDTTERLRSHHRQPWRLSGAWQAQHPRLLTEPARPREVVSRHLWAQEQAGLLNSRQRHPLLPALPTLGCCMRLREVPWRASPPAGRWWAYSGSTTGIF